MAGSQHPGLGTLAHMWEGGTLAGFLLPACVADLLEMRTRGFLDMVLFSLAGSAVICRGVHYPCRHLYYEQTWTWGGNVGRFALEINACFPHIVGTQHIKKHRKHLIFIFVLTVLRRALTDFIQI